MNVFVKKGAKHIISQVLIYAVLIFFTFMALYPLLWLFFSSFKTTQEYQLTSKLALPQVWWWRNYADAWVRGHFGTLFLMQIFENKYVIFIERTSSFDCIEIFITFILIV